MKKLLLILLFCTPVHAQFYLDVGIGWHDVQSAQPEVTFGKNLGYTAIGYEHRFKEFNISLDINHTSGVFEIERGAGLNSVSIKSRVYF